MIVFRGQYYTIMNKKTTEDFSWVKFMLDIFVDVVVVIGLVLIFRGFLYAPFQVHGPSMCDTLNVYDDECFHGDGEYLLTSKLATWSLFGWSPGSIERGDIIIFQAPYGEDGEFYIKRVIGMPGDSIKIDNGYVYLMDESGDYELLDESYLNEESLGHTDPYRATSEIYDVPEGSYFVMGDNRTKSSDSRRCFQQIGCSNNTSPFLDEELIESEAKLVIYPLSHWRLLESE